MKRIWRFVCIRTRDSHVEWIAHFESWQLACFDVVGLDPSKEPTDGKFEHISSDTGVEYRVVGHSEEVFG